MLVEHSHLSPPEAELFDLAEISFPIVDGLRCVCACGPIRCHPDRVPGRSTSQRPILSSCGTKADASPGMNAATPVAGAEHAPWAETWNAADLELIQLRTSEGWGQLRFAVEEVLSLGCHGVAAIRHLMVAEQFDRRAEKTKWEVL